MSKIITPGQPKKQKNSVGSVMELMARDIYSLATKIQTLEIQFLTLVRVLEDKFEMSREEINDLIKSKGDELINELFPSEENEGDEGK